MFSHILKLHSITWAFNVHQLNLSPATLNLSLIAMLNSLLIMTLNIYTHCLHHLCLLNTYQIMTWHLYCTIILPGCFIPCLMYVLHYLLYTLCNYGMLWLVFVKHNLSLVLNETNKPISKSFCTIFVFRLVLLQNQTLMLFTLGFKMLTMEMFCLSCVHCWSWNGLKLIMDLK